VTGYCSRGITDLVAGQPIDDALAVVERSCALAGTANRTALCQAIEAATGVAPALPARLTRVLFLEIERVLARLWTLATAARTANLSQHFGEALEQREALFTALVQAAGGRAFWGVAEPGGARADLALDGLSSAVKQIDVGLAPWRAAVSAKGPLGQAGTGVGKITPEQASAFSGLAARGSTASDDARQERPEGGYADLRGAISWPEPDGGRAGDVAARLGRAVDDLASSLAIIQAATEALGTAADSTAAAQRAVKATRNRATEGSATVEGPHGPVTVGVTLNGTQEIASLRIVPPGQALLAALPEILTGSQLGQVPLILASLDLCVECLDL
jgi:ech hydrogenase subunit E